MSWQTGNPPKSGYYLVTCQSLGSGPYVQIFPFNDVWLEDRRVLAWQPLPEPYRVEETKPTQAPWPNLVDGYTPPGLEFHDKRHGRMLLAQQTGSSWDGWLLIRNPEDTGWVSLRKATDGDLENLGLVQVVQRMLSTAAPEGGQTR